MRCRSLYKISQASVTLKFFLEVIPKNSLPEYSLECTESLLLDPNTYKNIKYKEKGGGQKDSQFSESALIPKYISGKLEFKT